MTPKLANRRSVLLGLAGLALAGCASAPKPQLFYARDSKVDLRAYRTFAFYPGPAEGPRSILRRNLLDAARGQLEHRGYVFEPQSPDLLVRVDIVVEERLGLRKTPGPLPGWDGVETEDYRLGRVAIELSDARRNEAVWSGVAEGRVNDTMLHDASTSAQKAVATIFEGFPVQSGMAAAAPAASTTTR